MEQPKMIKSFDELKGLTSETHYIEVAEIGDEGVSAWVRSKDRVNESDLYLSTHSFYDSHRKSSTQLLQERGFNVRLAGHLELTPDEEKLRDATNAQFNAMHDFIEQYGVTPFVIELMRGQIESHMMTVKQHDVLVDDVLPYGVAVVNRKEMF